MTDYSQIEEKYSREAIDNAKSLKETVREHFAGTEGEKEIANRLLNEIRPYCDESYEETFTVKPAASTMIIRIVCLLAIFAALLFKVSEITGSMIPGFFGVCCAVLAFVFFAVKFIFFGNALDLPFKKRTSQNLFFKRNARCDAINRVVITAHTDSQRPYNAPLKLLRSPYALLLCCGVGNTLCFCATNLYLLFGSPENSLFFGFLSDLCLLFSAFYFMLFLTSNNRKPEKYYNNDILPCLCAGELFHLFADKGIRFRNTEVCLFLEGSEIPCHDGAFAFLSRHTRGFKMIPTYFISLEEITACPDLSFFAKQSKRDKGDRILADTLFDVAAGNGIVLKDEASVTKSPASAPFAGKFFPACTLSSSRTSTARSTEEDAVNRHLVLLSETIRCLDNGANRQ